MQDAQKTNPKLKRLRQCQDSTAKGDPPQARWKSWVMLPVLSVQRTRQNEICLQQRTMPNMLAQKCTLTCAIWLTTAKRSNSINQMLLKANLHRLGLQGPRQKLEGSMRNKTSMTSTSVKLFSPFQVNAPVLQRACWIMISSLLTESKTAMLLGH